jgi:hypothetical protein
MWNVVIIKHDVLAVKLLFASLNCHCFVYSSINWREITNGILFPVGACSSALRRDPSVTCDEKMDSRCKGRFTLATEAIPERLGIGEVSQLPAFPVIAQCYGGGLTRGYKC